MDIEHVHGVNTQTRHDLTPKDHQVSNHLQKTTRMVKSRTLSVATVVYNMPESNAPLTANNVENVANLTTFRNGAEAKRKLT